MYCICRHTFVSSLGLATAHLAITVKFYFIFFKGLMSKWRLNSSFINYHLFCIKFTNVYEKEILERERDNSDFVQRSTFTANNIRARVDNF